MRAVPMKPSSVRRVAQLNILLAVLSVRALPPTEVAHLLGCSISAARNYLLELVAAGLVDTVEHGYVDGRMYKSLYRVRRDRALADAARARPAPGAGGPVRRDQLVSALFGT
jgi:DNA-binding IclR family transcriptional regulator